MNPQEAATKIDLELFANANLVVHMGVDPPDLVTIALTIIQQCTDDTLEAAAVKIDELDDFSHGVAYKETSDIVRAMKGQTKCDTQSV